MSDESAAMPDLLNDPISASDAAGPSGHPGSPSLQRRGTPSSNASEASGSYGGHVHMEPRAVAASEAAIWARAEAQALLHNNAAARQNLADSGVGSSNGDVDLMGSVSPPYPGFDASILKIDGVAQPPLLPAGELWHRATDITVTEMKPVRALRVLVPAALFRRDAANFSHWTMPTDLNGGGSRAYSTAALISMIFAGTAYGLPCGDHAEQKRQNNNAQAQDGQPGNGQGAKQRQSDITEYDRYVYIPSNHPSDEWPMWQMGYEEIQNEEGTDVTFIGIWLWTYDPMHSTSALIAQVMEGNQSKIKSQSANGQHPMRRNRNIASEVERRKKSGLGTSELNNNFEATVGLQHERIKNMETYIRILQRHAGTSLKNPTGAAPFVDDPVAHLDNSAGRSKLSGEPMHGSFHPAAVEFCCNAKRSKGLAFGAANLDGSPGSIHPKYLDTASYWDGDFFRLPEGEHALWICASVDRRTIFEMPLPRRLQNQVVAGPALMHLFLERERLWLSSAQSSAQAVPSEDTAAQMAAEAVESGLAPPNADLAAAQEMHQLAQLDDDSDVDVDVSSTATPMEQDEEPPQPRRITQHDFARFRSCLTQVDEEQRLADEECRGSLRGYDMMDSDGSPTSMAAALSSSDVSFSAGNKDGSYRMKVDKMTDRIAVESGRAWSKIINPWHVEMTRSIEDRRGLLEQESNVNSKDPRWAEIDRDEQEVEKRFSECKKDLAEYHLRCLFSCFHSKRDLDTIPDGYKAMVRNLEQGVQTNGNCASMAFPPRRKGNQITATDRQVWHELQEWLGVIFTTDAHIQGRDRFLMVSAPPACACVHTLCSHGGPAWSRTSFTFNRSRSTPRRRSSLLSARSVARASRCAPKECPRCFQRIPSERAARRRHAPA